MYASLTPSLLQRRNEGHIGFRRKNFEMRFGFDNLFLKYI